MKQEDLSVLTKEQLNARVKAATFFVVILVASVVVMLIAGVFLTIRKGFNVFTVMPLAFLPMVIVNAASLKKVKAELASRN